jgi:hypothetical protein
LAAYSARFGDACFERTLFLPHQVDPTAGRGGVWRDRWVRAGAPARRLRVHAADARAQPAHPSLVTVLRIFIGGALPALPG